MRLVLQTRKRCPGCGAQMIRADEKLQCPNGDCALSPLATLQFARAATISPTVPAGYVPADHRLPPPRLDPRSRPPQPLQPAVEDAVAVRYQERLEAGLKDGVWTTFDEYTSW